MPWVLHVFGQREVQSRAPRTFVLEGAGQQIEPHLGHRVEVTGRLIPVPAAAKTGDKAQIEHLRVRALTPISTDCGHR